ncbi:MAG: polysaccharide deacetylase family protein [Marinicella sp.]
MLLIFSTQLEANKQIALTFDDAPRPSSAFSSEKRTEMLLKALVQHGVDEVMFFVTTKHVNPETKGILDQYVSAGHLLANHSDQHLWFNKTDVEAYQQDMLKAHEVIKSYQTFQPFFRFPFLDEGRTQEKNQAMAEFFKKQGYANGYVTVDNYDWYLDRLYQLALKAGKPVDMEQLKNLYVDVLMEAITFSDDVAVKYLGRSPKHVLLLHDNDLAAMFIGDLIVELRKQDWEIISPLDAYQDPIAQQEPKTTFRGQGRVAALARDAGAQPKDLVHVAEDEDQLYELFTSYQVADIQNPQIPYWFRKEMQSQVGLWKASNAEYQSDSEPFSDYLIEWTWGIGKTHLNGQLYGLKEGEKTGNFWTFNQFWDPVKNQARLLQFGYGSKIGDGYIRPVGDQQIETIQTFSSPKITAYLERHLSTYAENGLRTTSFQQDEHGQWQPGRSYIWVKQSP